MKTPKLIHSLILGTVTLALGASSARSTEIDISSRLLNRNEVMIGDNIVKPYVYDPEVRSRLYFWLNHPQNREYVADCQANLRPFLQNEKLVGPACYLLRQKGMAKRMAVLDLVHRNILEIRTALNELAEDPQYDLSFQKRAKALKVLFDRDDSKAIEACFTPALKAVYNDAVGAPYSFSVFPGLASCLNKALPQITKLGGAGGKVAYLGVNLKEEFPNHPGHALSETGWVPGNKIEYLTKNDTSAEMSKQLEARWDLMPTLYPLDGAGSVDQMEARIRAKKPIFSEEEGFFTFENHPVWSEKTGIFAELRAGIDSAKSTIFSDIFFLGGTMGAALSKHLVELAETKGIKIFIIRDNINHFGHEAEMRPVYNYLEAYSRVFPGRITVASADILEHRSGLPRFLWGVVTQGLISASGLQSHLQLYARAQSDHSKVFVMDGKTAKPYAFVGSKNLTDSSGAICYDEVIKVTGPLATIIQDDYVDDMRAALRLAKKPIAEIVSLTRPFDPLERDANHKATVTSVKVPAYGNIQARSGMNNFNSTRTNIIDQNIQAILTAKKTILMKDQFLFDRNLIVALLDAKKANPGLDVRVILEPLHAATPHGMPNLLYLDILKNAGIKVKAKRVIENAKINQEYHMKTISVDGRYIISGSANKDQTTMYGAFREEQVQADDPVAAAEHDRVFEEHWNSSAETEEEFAQLDFTVPGNLKGFDGQPLSPTEFIKIVRNLLEIAFDAAAL